MDSRKDSIRVIVGEPDMKTAFFALTAAAFLAQQADAAPAVTAEDIYGKWRVPSNGSVVEIYKCGARLCCKVISVKDPRRRDIRNPNPALRHRPLVGVMLMNDGRRSGARSYVGDVYSTLDGQTYRGTLNVIGKNQITLVGCASILPICEAVTFTRLKQPPPTRQPESAKASHCLRKNFSADLLP
jgi:uncharacterized protein (DUF2147 family)